MVTKHCPLLKEECQEHRCRWYIQLMGSNPQTGAPIAEWGCAVEWIPILLIEQSKEVRQNAAAVESFRNENVNIANRLMAGLQEGLLSRLPNKLE